MAEGIYGGFEEAQQSGDIHQLSQFAIQDARDRQAGQQAILKTFQAMTPGASPFQAPQGQAPQFFQGPAAQNVPPSAMAPPGSVAQGPPPGPPQAQPMDPGQLAAWGQQNRSPLAPGVPLANNPPPQPPGQAPYLSPAQAQARQAANQQMQGRAPAPSPQPQGGPPQGQPRPGGIGMPGQGGLASMIGGFDITQAATAIMKNNPNITGGALVSALTQMQAIMKPEAQEQLRMLQLQLQYMRENDLERYRAFTEGATTARLGQGQQRLDIQGQREQRLEAAQKVREDLGIQKLQLERDKFLNKQNVEAAKGNREALKARLRQINDNVKSAIQSHNEFNNMDPKERDQLLKDQDEKTEELLKKIDETAMPAGSQASGGGKPIPPDAQKMYDASTDAAAKARARELLQKNGYDVSGLK